MNLHATDFEKSYTALRQKERRVYSDRELLQLPDIDGSHPHFKEWQSRKESASRLMRYLSRHSLLKKLLEIGCGNGWLSARLASVENKEVTGMDINISELAQAERVFGNRGNLQFLHGDVQSEYPKEKFDCIVFAACMQYFGSVKDIIDWSMKKLNDDGELHILDTHFYTASQQAAAKDRSAAYYKLMGFPELNSFYHHHLFSDLQPYSVDKLYSPSLFKKYVQLNKNPFPWFRIKKRKPA
jgi:cyclopropane fatty-acyl-phospholipid synthase-like methyltransferase